MNESRSTLPARNLQALLDSATNAAAMGARQYFTPDETARFLTSPRFLPGRRRFAGDLFGCGAGALLSAIGADHSLGIDIDPRSKTDSAVVDPKLDKRLVADVTELYPLMAKVGLQFPLLASNPPFSLHWHWKRIERALLESRNQAVVIYANKHIGETIDSTLATYLMMLDALNIYGEGVLLANHDTVKRLILDDEALSRHAWLVVRLSSGVLAPDCSDFPACALYFATDHRTGPHEIDLSDIDHPEALADCPVIRAVGADLRIYHKRGISSDQFLGDIPALLGRAGICGDELRRIKNAEDGGIRPTWNLSLGAIDGKIQTYLTPFQHLDNTLDADSVRVLNSLRGQHPEGLVVQNHSRRELLAAVGNPLWRVQPELVAAVQRAVDAYHRDRATLAPLPPVQRLGYVDEWEELKCSADGLQGFRKGESYRISTHTEQVSYTTHIANSQGTKDKVVRTGQELVVRISDSDHAAHTFHYRLEGRDYEGKTTRIDENPLAHRIEKLVEHFEIPAVPDVVDADPEGYRKNLDRLADLELEIGARTGDPFEFRFHQKDHLARAGMVKGLGIVWEQGLGKTIAMFTAPRLWNPDCVLIVSPGSIIPQTIREGAEKFGVDVKQITCAQDIMDDPFLRRRFIAGPEAGNLPPLDSDGGTRYYAVTYTALGMNGADERGPKIKGKGHDRTIDWPQNVKRLRNAWMKANRLDAVEFYNPETGELETGFDSRNIGTDEGGIRCLAWPSLSTLIKDVFDCVICDEAVRIKNGATHQSLGVRRLNPEYRMILTGTPIKNNLIDAFYLAHWVCGGGLVPTTRWPYASDAKAQAAFAGGHLIREENLTAARRYRETHGKFKAFIRTTNEICNIHRLWKLFSPVFLRKRKADIAANLVPKTIIPMTVKLGTEQKRVYGFHVRNAPKFGGDGEPLNALGKIGTQLSLLRLAALCPDSGNLNGYHGPANGPEVTSGAWAWTPKLGAVLTLVAQLVEKGEQVLIGSTYQHFSKSLHARLRQAGISALLLDGNTDEKRRGLLAGEFKAKRHSVLIAGVKSMGEGHSFDQCPNLILPCLDWAYDSNAQIIERVHRLSSRQDVKIFTILTEKTLDERLAQIFGEKSDSAGLALDGQLATAATEEINLAELLNQAVENYDPEADTIDEQQMADQWKHSLKARLTAAEHAFQSKVIPLGLPEDEEEDTVPAGRWDSYDIMGLLALHQPHAKAPAPADDEAAIDAILHPEPAVAWRPLSFADLLATLHEAAS